jgi:hypothetical protein
VPAPARCLLVGHRDADPRLAGREPAGDDGLRGIDEAEPLEARGKRVDARGRRGRGRPRGAPIGGHGSVPAQWAAAATPGSGRSSSKALWSARDASSICDSSIMQVIRTSDVEIISMLIPSSASVPNIRAA